MIELRYLHVEGSDRRTLQYRYQHKVSIISETQGGIFMEWTKWKFVPGIIVSAQEYEDIQIESE